MHATTSASAALDLASPAGVAALRQGWRAAQPRASLPTQDAAFTLALGQTLLAGQHLVLFRAGPALLPLARRPGWRARWQQPGADHLGEPGDALCPGPAEAEALARALVGSGRAVELARVPATSLLIPALRAAARGRARVTLRPDAPAPYIALGPEWAEPAACFSARRRSDFRRAARRAEQFGAVACEVHAPGPARFDALFDEAIAVERRGWKDAAGTAIASDAAKTAFFRAYLGAAAAEGRARIAFLRIDGRAVAMQLAVEWAGRYWLYKIGYDEAYARCSPGTLLMLHALGDAARRGLSGFELMGEAESWIAALWTRTSHPCRRVRVYPFNLRGAVAFAQDAAAWGWQRWRG